MEKAADAFNKTMEMEAKSCKKSIADAVNAEKEKVAEQEATCKGTTAIAVEKEVGLCKKTTAIAVKKEAESCKKSISNAVNVEKEKEATWCEKNSVMFEKSGPFKVTRTEKIGEITKYYFNYEFSMDLRFAESDLQKGMTALFGGIV